MRHGPGPRRDVGIARAVDHALRQDGLAPCLALGDHATDRTVPHDRQHELPVQHGLYAGFLDEHVRDVLEHLGIERMADRLRLRRRRAHGLGALLEFDADAFAVDGRLVPVPCEPLDAHLRDIAAEATIAFEQRRLHACACGRKRGCKTARATADHEHVRLVDDVDFT